MLSKSTSDSEFSFTVKLNIKFLLISVKKFTGQGISDIRNKIVNEQIITNFDSFDEFEKAEEFVNGIKKLGGTIKLYGNSIEALLNLAADSIKIDKLGNLCNQKLPEDFKNLYLKHIDENDRILGLMAGIKA